MSHDPFLTPKMVDHAPLDKKWMLWSTLVFCGVDVWARKGPHLSNRRSPCAGGVEIELCIFDHHAKT